MPARHLCERRSPSLLDLELQQLGIKHDGSFDVSHLVPHSPRLEQAKVTERYSQRGGGHQELPCPSHHALFLH